MTKISKDKLEEKADSVYRLVLIAAERTKQLAKGSKPLIKTNARKATTVALEEVLEGKVHYEDDKTRRGET